MDASSELSCITERFATRFRMQSQSDAVKIVATPCTMSSAEFLRDPKRALEMVSNGTQVCVKSNKTQVILGFEGAEQKTVRKKALFRRTKGARTFTSSSTQDPANVSWLE
jgi:hypothetical protein